jgi:cellulose synthase/poly-beta-1,6-N-acetylglucosamine synthase-like glycosyltransferase
MNLPALTIIVLILVASVLSVHFAVAVGIVRAKILETLLRRRLRGEGSPIPSVSVLVPARNEEKALPLLLASLTSQTVQHFELVLVNDRSTDGTQRIMEQYAEAHPGRVKVVNLTENGNPVNPKQYALTKAAEVAGGRVVLFTDADCVVPVTWVEEMAGAFRDPEIGVVIGTIVCHTSKGYLPKYQSFDYFFRFYYTAGCTGLDLATGGFGNNMGVRREALEAFGGIGAIGKSVTEDAEIISHVRELKRYKVRALTVPDTIVKTRPQPDWRSTTAQGLRWNAGGIYAPDLPTRLSYGFVMFYLLLGVLLLPFGFLQPLLWLVYLSAVGSMALVAVMAGAASPRPFVDYWLLLVPHLALASVYYSYITVLTVLRVPIQWKGRKLKRGS